MSKSINKVILVGYVGQDPETAILRDNLRVANFSLATNRQWKDKSGQQREETDWHRCKVWNELADIVQERVKKGDQLYIEGRLKYDKVEKDGETKYYTSIIVSQLVMLDGGGSKRGKKREQFIPRELGDRNQEDLPF